MRKNQPRVSIGMPVYNGDRFLKQALDSILAQTFKAFELIISDNASTDKTQEICQAYAAQDQRIRYYRNEQNLGAGWNQSHVVELSTGEYFKWAHHDDVCAPELFEQCVEVLDRNPAVVLCYPKTIIIDEHGQHIEKYFDGLNIRSSKTHQRFKQYHNLIRYGHRSNPPFHGMIRTNTLKTTPLVGSYPSSDLILLGELVLHGEFYEIPEYLFFKRDHPNTSVRTHRTYRERIAWYDPTKKGKLHLTKWKWFVEYLRAIRRVHMSGDEKVRCYIQMTKWVLWNWVWLTKDLIKAASWPFLQPFLNFELNRQIEKNAQS
jgi:glycosyltransferase involved in cell wall biosynthesis